MWRIRRAGDSLNYLWGRHKRRAKRRYADLCAVAVVSTAVLVSGVRPAFAVSDAPKGNKLVFRDAGAKSHSEVLAIAALYLRTADAVDPNLRCFLTFWLETTVHREDRTWPLPDVCHWRLAGSMTSSSIVIHYKPSKRGCMSS